MAKQLLQPLLKRHSTNRSSKVGRPDRLAKEPMDEPRPGRYERGSLTVVVISSLQDFLLLARMLGRPSFKLSEVRTRQDARDILLQSFGT
jgi:hypothetical protein